MQFMQKSWEEGALIVQGNFGSEFTQLNVLKGGILRCLFIKSETARIYQLSQHKVFFSFPFAQTKKFCGIPQIYIRIYTKDKFSFIAIGCSLGKEALEKFYCPEWGNFSSA